MKAPKKHKGNEDGSKKIEAMILEDVSKMDGCPQNGITVTVYDIPWKSILMLSAAAGPARSKTDL